MVGLEGVVDAGTVYALRFLRGRGQADAVATWYVAEFCSGVSAERGVLSGSGPVSTVTHAAMAVNQSYGMTIDDSNGTTYDENDFCRVKPVSATQLEVSVTDPTLGAAVRWQIWENTGMTVQHGTGFLDAGVPLNVDPLGVTPPAASS